MPKVAVVLLTDGFEEIEAVTPIDVLRRAGVEVFVAAVEGDRIHTAGRFAEFGKWIRAGAREVLVVPDGALGDATLTPDLVVLPGGLRGAQNLAASEAARKYVLAVHAAGNICAAICATPALAFAPWGLLDNRRATCYPGMQDRFPPSARYVEDAVVVDGNVVTSRGPGTAFAFALTLAGLLAGPEAEANLRRDMIVE